MLDRDSTSSEYAHANAFTNNTFSLPETELAIKSTVENSFKYLQDLQKSYINISRFNLTEDDVYILTDDVVCLSVDKDLIDSPKRKIYKRSSFYNKELTLEDIGNNPDIFSFIPLVFIDGKSLFSYKIKSSLDGRTVFTFTHIKSLQKFMGVHHNIEIVFIKKMKYEYCITNRFVGEKYNWIFPNSVTGFTFKPEEKLFAFFRNPEEDFGTNIFPISMDDNGNLIIDNEEIKNYFYTGKEIEIRLFSIPHLIEIEGTKQIHHRVDNNKLSSTLVIFDKDDITYKMPIPPENLFILKINKVTKEISYQNNRDVILH